MLFVVQRTRLPYYQHFFNNLIIIYVLLYYFIVENLYSKLYPKVIT